MDSSTSNSCDAVESEKNLKCMDECSADSLNILDPKYNCTKCPETLVKEEENKKCIEEILNKEDNKTPSIMETEMCGIIQQEGGKEFTETNLCEEPYGHALQSENIQLKSEVEAKISMMDIANTVDTNSSHIHMKVENVENLIVINEEKSNALLQLSCTYSSDTDSESDNSASNTHSSIICNKNSDSSSLNTDKQWQTGSIRDKSNLSDAISDSSSDESSERECSNDSEGEDARPSVCKKLPIIKPVKSKDALPISDLPEIQNLHISVPEDSCKELGKVCNTVDKQVVIEPYRTLPTLNIDTVLFLDKGSQALGYIDDVFGQVSEPYYTVVFSSVEQIKEMKIEIGTVVYFAPNSAYAHYVFIKDIQTQGSDASWENDNEPPVNVLDYSDDEEERKAKSALKQEKKRKDCLEDEPVAKKRNIVHNKKNFSHFSTQENNSSNENIQINSFRKPRTDLKPPFQRSHLSHSHKHSFPYPPPQPQFPVASHFPPSSMEPPHQQWLPPPRQFPSQQSSSSHSESLSIPHITPLNHPVFSQACQQFTPQQSSVPHVSPTSKLHRMPHLTPLSQPFSRACQQFPNHQRPFPPQPPQSLSPAPHPSLSQQFSPCVRQQFPHSYHHPSQLESHNPLLPQPPNYACKQFPPHRDQFIPPSQPWNMSHPPHQEHFIPQNLPPQSRDVSHPTHQEYFPPHQPSQPRAVSRPPRQDDFIPPPQPQAVLSHPQPSSNFQEEYENNAFSTQTRDITSRSNDAPFSIFPASSVSRLPFY